LVYLIHWVSSDRPAQARGVTEKGALVAPFSLLYYKSILTALHWGGGRL